MTVDWGVGRYELVAEQLRPAAQAVVEAADVQPGERVLDVGCGTGNAALLAAGRGGVVAAVDPAGRLLEVARERAAGEGLAIDFRSGEAASLPVPDGAFDVVLSVFAAVFAPDPEAALTDITRALAPAGRLLLSAWIPGGAVGRMYQVSQEAVREAVGAPPGPPPFAWHDRAQVESLAEPLGLTVEGTEHALAFTAPSPEAYLDSELDNHPAAIAGYRTLTEHGVDTAALRAELAGILRDGNEDPGAFRATSRYLIWTLRRT